MTEITKSVFPTPIETERLVIRAPDPGTGKLVHQAISESYAELHEWMEWASYMPKVDETERRMKTSHEAFHSGLDFPIQAYRKGDGVLVTIAGLHPVNWNVPSFEIGYWCRSGYQGQGYVTEVVRALTKVGFNTLGANRIQICCYARNIRSRRVAELAGYELEAELKNEDITPDGRLRNTLVFARFPLE